MNAEIITFQKCLDIASSNGGKKHLMLGNGFSVALFPNIFNYKQLAEKLKSTKIKRLFTEMQTVDFEFVMHKLSEALKVINLYENNSDLFKNITSDLDSLKKSLIEVIQESHPEKPNIITDLQYEYCRLFLKAFDRKKYTFNYDLLLYWVYMHFLEHTGKPKELVCNDGFCHPQNDQSIVQWEMGNEYIQDIYYLHGALHIFSDQNGIEKYTWINSGKSISTQVRNSIDEGKYPLFISEGTKEHKMARIRENGYLMRAFSSMKAIAGSLFIFGHSLRDEDEHVFEMINKNKKLTKIFISMYGDENSNQKLVDKVKTWRNDFQDKKYYLFDAKTANVWGENG